MCENPIEMVSDFQNPQPVKKGNIIVCGHCGSILRVGDGGLVKVTKEEFKALDKQSKYIVGTLVTTILGRNVAERLQAEGWFN